MSDLIDREEAIKAVYDKDIGMLTQWDIGRNAGIDYAIKQLEKLPSAQPERKVGKWTKDNACEFCGFKPWYERDIHTLSYCPNCGADMRGEQYE